MSEIRITVKQKNLVDRYIELMNTVQDFRKEYPSLYGLLNKQIILPSSQWELDRITILSRETLRYKAIAHLLEDEERINQRVKKEQEKMNNNQ